VTASRLADDVLCAASKRNAPLLPDDPFLPLADTAVREAGASFMAAPLRFRARSRRRPTFCQPESRPVRGNEGRPKCFIVPRLLRSHNCRG
jgi:hypothetical protein